MFVSSKQVVLKMCDFNVLPSETLFIFTLIREEDKNIFDYCRENNIDHVTKVIKSKNVDVNMKDEEVWKTCLNYFLMLCCSTPVLLFEMAYELRLKSIV